MNEHLFKILVIGDGEVGKSSFLHRYVNGQFNKTYKMTMGVDYSLKLLYWSDKEKVRLHLWDIAGTKHFSVDRWMAGRHNERCVFPTGQERFISMNRIYYKGALGCVVMFDVTNPTSFRSCRHWKQDLDNKAMLPNGDSIPCILLANKCDLAQRAVTTDSIKRFSEANGFVTWMEISVKENMNVGEAMRRLVQEIMSVESSLDGLQHEPQNVVHPQLYSERGAGCC
ncbi:ras-related protein Rab-7L1-like isoform X2 [Cottoperca gobio]|uniref:Ras-related protein Rab n=1 Tax=Cottoperca gobio TaxID=56716 RepID=A0A6J2P7T3_COTGO|nr:ras-related protein Rab-7L1-like isoform X2 [Cottoperca gobio]XP_029282032.1 ras-related protein Rab-7L1-like isoform X2 [Cottoperca gobio]XP_029282033.1 ras-related protein Rab-7L1-like isoform X2 [Cottoperca gobio]